MEITKDITCKECGAIVKENTDITYCPKCGTLLPDKTENVVISKRERDLLSTNYKVLGKIYKTGYAPVGKQLVERDEYNRIKKKVDRYEHISDGALVIGLGLLIALFITACYFVGKWLDQKPKVRLEIVKDKATGKYGIYDNDKDLLVTPYEYDSIQYRNWVDAESYKRNYYCLFKNGLIGVADSTGAVRVACELSNIEGAYSGLIIMRENGYEGLFDTYGTPLFRTDNYHVLWVKKPALDYYTPGTFVGNIIPVKHNTNSGWELYDRTGKRITGNSYPEAIQAGTPNLIKVKYNGYYGLINTKGQEVVKCKAKWISRYQENIAFVNYPDSKHLYALDTLGNTIFSISKEYKWQWPVMEGVFARMDNNGNIGYYNKTGKLVIPHKFEQAKDGNSLTHPCFAGDSARVSYRGQNGYVYKNGYFKPDAK